MAASTRSTPNTVCSELRPARAGIPTRTPCGRSSVATACSPTSRTPTTATSGGRACLRTRRPISAILFGGRRASTVPLVTESRDWTHGVFMGATLSSETTAAAAGAVGVVRCDPMAMLPFLGYHGGDYFGHWITLGKEADAVKLPKIYYVNWFRRGDDGKFIWPGFGENGRVLKWIVERLEGQAAAAESPIGRIPTVDSLDIDGLDLTL